MKENFVYEINMKVNIRKEIKNLLSAIDVFREFLLDYMNKQELPFLLLQEKRMFDNELDKLELNLKNSLKTLDYYNDVGICQNDIFT